MADTPSDAVALRIAIQALAKIRDGHEVTREDGSTEMVDWLPAEASGIASNAMERIGVSKDG